ncbi:hypothetical protein EJ06DRAFT_543713 [Trichodelitschia bisporula]|uniref:Protein-lysine N-methyltransferase EFM6 n=1 Tax=Trichodelitschia bisporula TaxID=703511 RepID=A0A6G1HT52_9PEZI|nr:hypothetical protein EJ06DRAFT_543713 [Trichodelitschia bisporula]
MDDPLSLPSTLTPLPEIKTAGTTTLSFSGLLNPPLILHEDLQTGCGGQIWPAGEVLATYMLRRHRDTLMEKTIVELGAGGGLAGLAIALGCGITSPPLLITDQEAMYPLMLKNIALNNLQSRVQPHIYNWGAPPPPSIPAYPSIILAADCVYFEPAFPLLLSTLQDLLGPSSVCFFCFKKRRKADMHFVKSVRKAFDVREVMDDPDQEVWSRQGLFLYEIRRKPEKGGKGAAER